MTITRREKRRYGIIVHNKNDTAQGHCHNADPLARRPGNGVHHPFQGRGKFRDAARCGGNVGEAKAEGQKAENGQTGERGTTSGKKSFHAHNDLRGGRHAALGWGAWPAKEL